MKAIVVTITACGIERYSWTPRCQGAKRVPEMRQLGVDRCANDLLAKNGVLRHADKLGAKNAALVNHVSYAVFERLQPFMNLNKQHADIPSDLKELLRPE